MVIKCIADMCLLMPVIHSGWTSPTGKTWPLGGVTCNAWWPPCAIASSSAVCFVRILLLVIHVVLFDLTAISARLWCVPGIQPGRCAMPHVCSFVVQPFLGIIFYFV